jgi:hypothetical protein
MRALPCLAIALAGCGGGSTGDSPDLALAPDLAPYTYYVSPARPAVQAQTYAQDHRNAPQWDKLTGYDYVSLSPRAQTTGGPVGGSPAAENLLAAGVKVLFVAFPCYFHYMDQPLPLGDVERDIEDLAGRYNGKLYRNDGMQQFAYGCYVLDFRSRPFVDALVQYWLGRAKIGKGLLLHEACGGIPTEDPNDPFYKPTVSQAELDWEDGYHYFVSELRRARPDWDVIAVCDRWESNSAHAQWRPDLYDGLFFEHVGSSLNPVGAKTFDQLAKGTRDVVALYDISTPQTAFFRRGAAAMALMRDALFLYGQQSTITQDIEHFGIYYGDFPTPAKEIAPGVWERVGTHGLVVFNESGMPYTYQGFTLGSPDGLSAQFKDRDTGADLADWITNSGL